MGLYKTPGSPFWWFSFKCETGRIRKSTGVTDKKQAHQIYCIERSKFILNTEKDRPQPIKLNKLLETYLNDYSKTNKLSYTTDCFAVKTLNSFFGDRFVAEITPQLIERYKAHRTSTLKRRKPVSGARVNRELAILKTAFNKGIEWGLATDNPVRKVKFFNEKNRARTRYLSPEEKKRLLEACDPYLRRIVILALKTGMRRGEILNLKWSNIDFGANQITLRETKSGRMRHVPIHPDARNVLEELPKQGDYVFFDKDGSAINGRGRLRTDFEKVVLKAGLSNFTFHDLRHTFASELVMKGADLKTVSELMGHSTTRMTERYAHLSPAHKSVAIHLLPLEDKVPDPTEPRPNLP